MIEETLDRYSARDFATMLVTTHVAHAGRQAGGGARVPGHGRRHGGAAAAVRTASSPVTSTDARGLAAAGQEPGVVPPTLDAALEILGTLPQDPPA